jgi:hypothetical protein
VTLALRDRRLIGDGLAADPSRDYSKDYRDTSNGEESWSQKDRL